jgi:molecular chaperone GrpE
MDKKKAPDDTLNYGQDRQYAQEDVENLSERAEDKSESAENQSENAEDRTKDAEASDTDSGREEEKAEADKEDEELNARYLRLAADFQNYRKRVERERSEIYAYANEKIVLELLDVADNFERALQHSGSNESFAEGMSMIFKQFMGVLERSGVEEIIAEGEPFDPNFHHAVLTESSADIESGKVIQVLQKGYLLNKKVIRPAMVKVAE